LVKKDTAQLRSRVLRSAEDKSPKELIDALAVLAELPVNAIATVVKSAKGEALVALGKACGIAWPDMQKVIAVFAPDLLSSGEKAGSLFEMYAALSATDAQRAMQFMRTNASRNSEKIRALIRSGPSTAAAS